MTVTKWLQWQYTDNGAVVFKDDVLYKVVWAPDTLAERLLGQKVDLPDASSPGVLVDGDKVTSMSANEVTTIKAETYRDDEGWAKYEAELDAQYEKEAAEAVASATFQTLPMVSDATMFLKPPRSEKEVHNLLAVRGIPNIVQLVGRTEDKLVLVHAGVTVTDLLRKSGIDSNTRRKIAIQVAEALAALHKLGIHHRDLTTFNVLVSGDRATICDLESGPISLYIKAPEVVLDDAYTDKSDVFSFGLFLWSLENRSVPRAFNSRFLDRTGQFASVMDQCLHADPAQRPTMVEVAQQLRL